MGDEFSAKYGAILALQFGIANAVTNQTVTDLAAADSSGNTLVVMPKGGSVVGISVNASAEIAAGTVAFRAHKDSTEFAHTGYPNPEMSTAAAVTNEAYDTIRPGILTFSAGEAVGVSYASSTDMDPTDTNDFSVLLFVQLDPN